MGARRLGLVLSEDVGADDVRAENVAAVPLPVRVRVRVRRRHRSAGRRAAETPRSGAPSATGHRPAGRPRRAGPPAAGAGQGAAVRTAAGSRSVLPGGEGRPDRNQAAPCAGVPMDADSRQSANGHRPDSRCPARTTAIACRSPGRRPSRSIGPLTLIAAITRPVRSRIGADTLATPASRSATLCDQPRRRTSARVRPVNLHRGSNGITASGGSHARRIWAAEPAVIGKHRAHWHRVPQTAHPLRRRDTHPLIGPAQVKLRALAGRVAQRREHRRRRGQQHIGSGVGELAQPGARSPAALRIPYQHPMDLQRLRQPVGRRPWQLRALDQFSQTGPVDACAEDDYRLVQNANAAHTVSHALKHTSQIIGCPDGGSYGVTGDEAGSSHARSKGLGRPRRAFRRRRAGPALYRPASRS